MYSRLDTIPACDRQTDGQTEGEAEILPRHSPRYAYASRGKNERVIQSVLHACTGRVDGAGPENLRTVNWPGLARLVRGGAPIGAGGRGGS